MKIKNDYIFDVLIVGGGPGGLSCALSVARGGRNLVLCDDHRPRNKNAEGIRNLPGHEGINPTKYLELLKQGLRCYDHVDFRDFKVTSIKKEIFFFVSTLENSESIRSRKVVIAEGVEDILPDIPGLKELWGKYVFHCPYCHGYENVGKDFGVLITNRKSIQMIRLLKGLTDSIILFMNDCSIFTEKELEEFRSRDMKVFAGKVNSLMTEEKKLVGVKLENNEVVKCDTLFIQNEVKPRSRLGQQLGCTLLENGVYEVDGDGQSNVEGVYFAGDVGTPHHSVIMASAVGSHVGICVNAHLLENMFEHA
jgi:thioredoxin reductase